MWRCFTTKRAVVVIVSQEIEIGAESLEQGLEKEAVVLEQDLEKGLTSFGRGFTGAHTVMTARVVPLALAILLS